MSKPIIHPHPKADFCGLVAFSICAVSATLSIAAILVFRHIAAMDLDLEGGGAFSMYSTPNFLALTGMGFGLGGLLFTAIAIGASKRRGRFLVNSIHALSVILLAPCGYLLFRLLN